MRYIAVASGKGGVGRTTILANIGLALADLGKKIVIIDGNLTTPDLTLFFKLERAFFTLNDVLSGEVTIEDVLHTGPKGLKIVPAAVTLEGIKKANINRLAEVIHQMPEKTDFVLIDAPCGLRRETIATLKSTREVLFVTTPETISIPSTMKTYLITKYLGLKPLGIILNRVRKEGFELSPNDIQAMLNLPVLAQIPEDKKILMALRAGKLLLELYHNSPAAKAIKELAKKILR